MVIVSLVAAGFGLAIDVYGERKARRENNRRNSDLPDGQIEGGSLPCPLHVLLKRLTNNCRDEYFFGRGSETVGARRFQ